MPAISAVEKQSIEIARDAEISEQGMDRLSTLFEGYTRYPIPSWFSPLWDTQQEDPHRVKTTPHGTFPIKYAGKLPKRLAQYANQLGTKLTQEQVSELGTTGASYRLTTDTIIFDITDRFNWRAGEFGDGESCFWGARSAARPSLESAGALAIRFYDTLGNGIGRAWLAPISKGNWVIFNAYATYGTWISQNGSTLKAMTNFLGEHYGLSIAKCSLDNYGRIDGTLWINGGSGYILYNGTKPSTHVNLKIDIGDESICPICGECEAENEMVYIQSEHRYVCEYCYYDNYGYCDCCEETTDLDEMHWIEDEELHLCQYCFDDMFAECTECGEIFRKEELIEDSCLECSAGKIAHCLKCGEVYDIADEKPPEQCDNRLLDDSGYYRVLCNGVVVINCAECLRQTEVGDCFRDSEGRHYCSDCKGHISATCGACGVQKNQAYMHTDRDLHLCFACSPSLFCGQTRDTENTTYRDMLIGVWNHAN